MDKVNKTKSKQKYGLVFESHIEKIYTSKLVEVANFSLCNGSENNILIEGENLIALNILQEKYVGNVDVICIDPPYNTGMDWLNYCDHEYIDYQDSYSHSKWLSFMENRLNLAYNLLSKNGVMYINIDEHETGTLLLLCHQIFGEQNVNVLIWPKTDSRFDMNRIGKPAKDINIVHEYIFVCFKDRNNLTLNKIKKPTLKDGNYVDVTSVIESILIGFGTTSSAKDEIKSLFGDRYIFQTPKPMRLFKELIRAASKSNSIILDFFAGSGTTGHATMDLNNEDGGKRQFILVNNNENNICRSITYQRLKKAIENEGYKESLKYYQIRGENES